MGCGDSRRWTGEPVEEVSAPAAGSRIRARCGAGVSAGRGAEAALPAGAQEVAAAAEAREQGLGSQGRSAFPASAPRFLGFPPQRRPPGRPSRRRFLCRSRGCRHAAPRGRRGLGAGARRGACDARRRTGSLFVWRRGSARREAGPGAADTRR